MKKNKDKKQKATGKETNSGYSVKRHHIIVFAILLLITFFGIYDGFLDSARMGHDYKYFVPQLLDGAYWWHVNGFLSIPWFTPSLGGGLPNFPNPQSIYYSVPQFLAFFTDPVTSIRITMVLFAIAGFAGFYLVLKKVFGMPAQSSALGAAFFMFNGFYAHRMLVGHLTYHSFMLFPFLLYSVLNGGHSGLKADRKAYIRDVAVGGLVIAYMVYSGAFYLVPMFVLSVLLCSMIYGFIAGDRMSYGPVLVRLFFVLLVGTCAAASKLNASFSFVSLFPRNLYPLPGVDDLVSLIKLTFQAFFLEPDSAFANEVTVNRKFRLERHEYEFGISLVALLVLLFGFFRFINKYVSGKQKASFTLKKKMEVVAFLFLALIPLSLNYFTPRYNEFLKSLPFITSTSTNIRWLCVYIPCGVLLVAIVYNNIKATYSLRMGVAVLLILFLLLDNSARDRRYYKNQRYNPVVVTEKYDELKSGKLIPEIKNIGDSVRINFMNREVKFQGNELFVFGTSRLRPYEPMFGYRLETFPMSPLIQGDPLSSFQPGILNLKNPSGYLFPTENNCKPGGHFTTNQKAEAENFLHYKPFAFKMPQRQVIANYVSFFTCLLLMCSMLLTSVILPLKNRSKTGA